MCSLIIVLTLFVLVPGQTVEADSWPVIGNVEAQPLLAQVKRLDAALEYLGQPLPAVTRSAVANLTEKDGDKLWPTFRTCWIRIVWLLWKLTIAVSLG
jgi:hypothetical protein